jgi:hypothetical protein
MIKFTVTFQPDYESKKIPEWKTFENILIKEAKKRGMKLSEMHLEGL